MNCYKCLLPIQEGKPYWNATLYHYRDDPTVAVAKEHFYCPKCLLGAMECGEERCSICLELIETTDKWWEFILVEGNNDSLLIIIKEKRWAHDRCWDA